MNLDDPHQRAVFFALHSGNPREGPGDRASTARALEAVTPMPETVLDLGCGPGEQTRFLAQLLPESRIVAVDLHPPFVDAVRAWIEAAGLGERVVAEVGDMRTPPAEPGSVDLVWSEAAAYSIGVGDALRAWRPLLRPGGWVAFSELVFTGEDLSTESRAFWEAEYPAMTDLAGVERWIADAGYACRERFLLPPSAWWAYYGPLESRIEVLRGRYAGDSTALALLDEAQREVDVYRRDQDGVGYAFFVCQAPGG